jgi:hypothetical protein
MIKIDTRYLNILLFDISIILCEIEKLQTFLDHIF